MRLAIELISSPLEKAASRGIVLARIKLYPKILKKMANTNK